MAISKCNCHIRRWISSVAGWNGKNNKPRWAKEKSSIFYSSWNTHLLFQFFIFGHFPYISRPTNWNGRMCVCVCVLLHVVVVCWVCSLVCLDGWCSSPTTRSTPPILDAFEVPTVCGPTGFLERSKWIKCCWRSAKRGKWVGLRGSHVLPSI